MAMPPTKESFKHWLELQDYSTTTINSYTGLFNKHIENLVSVKGLEKFVPKTRRNPMYKGFLNAYLTCFDIPYKIPKAKRKVGRYTKQYKFLTKEEINKMIKELPPYLSLMVRLYFDTGLRLRELIDARWENIDPLARTIKGVGKGGKPFNERYSSTTAKLLRWYVLQYLTNEELEYPFHRGRRNKDHARSFWYYLKKECEKIGIEKVHPHRIRHALGHHLRADKGFDIQQIKVKLRHSSISSTEIYTDATKEEVEKKIEEEVFEE